MALLTAMTFATQTVIALAGGWASDRLVASGLPEGPVRKAINVGANVVKACAILGIAHAQSQVALIGWLVLTGVTIGLTGPAEFRDPADHCGVRSRADAGSA